MPPLILISAFAINCASDSLFPGAVGVLPATFATIVPGARWTIQLAPLDGGIDVGAIVGQIQPRIEFISPDLTVPLSFRFVFGAGVDVADLVIVGADLQTPTPGAAVVWFTLHRTQPTT